MSIIIKHSFIGQILIDAFEQQDSLHNDIEL